MRILLSNDDGYLAPGLARLAEVLRPEFDLTVVAPERNCSGSSNSLTLTIPLRAQCAPNGFYYIDGTPTDCVHLAITGLMEEEPDMVIAGINRGANLGDDVLYSGTVAAATEGRFLGYPALAVSLVGPNPKHFATAAAVVKDVLDALALRPLPSDTILNINVPDLPKAQLSGYRATRLGHRHKSEPVIRSQDPTGETIYWVGPPGAEQDAGEGTDFHAIRNGFVSISPLTIDLTRHESLQQVSQWLAELP